MKSPITNESVQFDRLFDDPSHDWVATLVRNDDDQRKVILHVEQLIQNSETKEEAARIANILIELGVDTPVVLAGALFYAVRNKEVDVHNVENNGISKLVTSLLRMAQADVVANTGAPFLERQSRDQSKNVRRMLIALIDDPRVAVLKLAERLVMLRTAQDFPQEQRMKIANEVLEFYCPLANRLGIWQLKWMLEDLSFAYLHEDSYKEIAGQLRDRRGSREKQVAAVCEDLRWRLDRAGIKTTVTGRAKNIYGIWRKMQEKDISFDAVYDVEAVRVIVDSPPECYAVLGVVHTSWPPIPNTFDDYIANPKANGYRSIHTAVVGPRGRNLEVQIRSQKMHKAAELGVCAHWAYKDDDAALNMGKVDWMREVLNWQEEMQIEEYIDFTRRNDAPQRIYIATPKGHVIDLPSGSTGVDFAYYVHTEIGNHCCGVKINGNEQSLNVALRTGQMVEILTDPDASPDRKWLESELGYVRTSRARRSIQEWFRSELEHENVNAGRARLIEECQRMKIDVVVEKLAAANGYKNVKEMYVAVAVGDQPIHDLLPVELINGEAVHKPDAEPSKKQELVVQELEVSATDRPRLLLDITMALATLSVNVVGAALHSPRPGEAATLNLKVEVDDFEKTRRVINKLRAVPDVSNVLRIEQNER
ncbi:MAG: bifunctional (p)ppGpp synthetase/guanosine-3',5'-bis(diphosphate) 3'-pyrophosphohydrolase [Gammaproteobacteria bacterium]|nr:bifunctional (p)ppGpp synthetase/guanosine-3',5'-bis(diphosphate) 3'-pyrophosphohydrolase [Gammaproteobacteria bacterium]MYD81023.1 bifunctional (p)ppGpp synthetase/guanosine-3',5'-bis(diphosphate) 3'-pyrophosphohydrolase [Gammaproteobacteria bacterium]